MTEAKVLNESIKHRNTYVTLGAVFGALAFMVAFGSAIIGAWQVHIGAQQLAGSTAAELRNEIKGLAGELSHLRETLDRTKADTSQTAQSISSVQSELARIKQAVDLLQRQMGSVNKPPQR